LPPSLFTTFAFPCWTPCNATTRGLFQTILTDTAIFFGYMRSTREETDQQLCPLPALPSYVPAWPAGLFIGLDLHLKISPLFAPPPVIRFSHDKIFFALDVSGLPCHVIVLLRHHQIRISSGFLVIPSTPIPFAGTHSRDASLGAVTRIPIPFFGRLLDRGDHFFLFTSIPERFVEFVLLFDFLLWVSAHKNENLGTCGTALTSFNPQQARSPSHEKR